MKKIILYITATILTIACSKPDDYCEEEYKRYYYDFDTKTAMVETVNVCYYFK